MRTTLTIDDSLATRLKKQAFESGKPFKQVVNEVLRAGLDANSSVPGAREYHLVPSSLGTPRPGFVLDKALQLAAELEDVELLRKMETRK